MAMTARACPSCWKATQCSGALCIIDLGSAAVGGGLNEMDPPGPEQTVRDSTKLVYVCIMLSALA